MNDITLHAGFLSGRFGTPQRLTPEEIRDRLEDCADPESAHTFVDDLFKRVLTAIRDGHHDPAGLARAALVVDEADFLRWCA